ncbi:MAG: PqqD family protein [Bacteroidales bacterium]|nr:PqqD family protein [Bacteroidales bacterium]
MRIKSNFKIREIAGESIIVNQGQVGADLTRIISLNTSARLLYEALEGKEFELEDVAQTLVDNYGIDKERALTDGAKWVESLKGCGVIG